jgi:hypothetical protein
VQHRRVRHSLRAALAVAFVAGAARAQSSTKSADAETPHAIARGPLQQADLEPACAKFEQSLDLDLGGGTRLALAECYQRRGKFASAWSAFEEALALARRDGRSEHVEYAEKQLAILEPKISKVTIQVPKEAIEPGLTVMLDGAPLAAPLWGVGKPVDPGTHQVTASAPNKVTFERRIEIQSGASTLQIPKLADRNVTPRPRPVDTDTEKKAVSDEVAAGSGRRTLGFAVGGIGIVALGVGSYFGLRAFSKWGEREDNCAGGCNRAAKSAGDAAKGASDAANIGIGVGLVAVGVGAYLVLSSGASGEAGASHGHRVRRARRLQLLPAVAATEAGLVLRGAY